MRRSSETTKRILIKFGIDNYAIICSVNLVVVLESRSKVPDSTCIVFSTQNRASVAVQEAPLNAQDFSPPFVGSLDRPCGLVVRVLGYRSGGPGSISGTTRKKVVGLEQGPLSLVSTTEELLDRKVAAPV
jgi:hypothetical protein